MKLSKYNIINKLNSGNYLVFNSFSGAMAILTEKDYHDMINLNNQNKHFNEWASNLLVIEDNFDEIDFLNKEREYGINNCDKQIFTILTTMACNARCFYCYEENMCPLTMNLQTADKVIDFILQNLKTDKELHIQWFGGEPLLGTKCIDYITKKIQDKCKEKNIKYTSSIITNGTLINKNLLEKMINNWNISSIQISLDGRKEEYEKRKNYINKKFNYELLMENLKLLATTNLHINIRINIDKNNFEDCLFLVDELAEIFKNTKDICIYFARLYGEDKNLIADSQANEYFEKIYQKLLDKKLIKTMNYFALKHTSRYCQSFGKYNYVLDPSGKIFKCAHRLNNPLNGSHKDDCSQDNLWLTTVVPPKCEKCQLLPMCQGGCKVGKEDNAKYFMCGGCSNLKYTLKATLNAVLKFNNIDDYIV